MPRNRWKVSVENYSKEKPSVKYRGFITMIKMKINLKPLLLLLQTVHLFPNL
jgi:hypothetical protein